jgi:hypothetical protein
MDLIKCWWGSLDGGSARREDNTQTEEMQRDIHNSSGIGTQDPSVRTGEDIRSSSSPGQRQQNFKTEDKN